MPGISRLALGALALVVPALAASPAFAASALLGSRTLQKGMTGPDVATLQEDLTIAGFPTTSTGAFSEGTKLHVEAFQSRFHVPADGVAGPQTVRLIKHIVKIAVEHEAAVVSKTGAVSATAATPVATSTTPTPTTVTTPTATTATGTTTTPAGTSTSTSTLSVTNSGGAGFVPPPSDAPFERGSISSTGLAVAPLDAPLVVREVIQAANQIAFLPYIYGGGHASFISPGYDCSGSVSFALHGAGMLSSPLDSSQFETWGEPGAGRWITLWANGAHVYMQVAGLWFDTAGQSSANGNDRWSVTRVSSASGFVEIHPAGW